ncbi:WhiB family transcriptional regulator [Streptomyces sp. NPDC002754]
MVQRRVYDDPDEPAPPCSAHPDLWFPDPGRRESDHRLALTVCGRCRYRRECRQAGEDGDERHGIWGGQNRTRGQRPPPRKPRRSQ